MLPKLSLLAIAATLASTVAGLPVDSQNLNQVADNIGGETVSSSTVLHPIFYYLPLKFLSGIGVQRPEEWIFPDSDRQFTIQPYPFPNLTASSDSENVSSEEFPVSNEYIIIPKDLFNKIVLPIFLDDQVRIPEGDQFPSSNIHEDDESPVEASYLVVPDLSEGDLHNDEFVAYEPAHDDSSN